MKSSFLEDLIKHKSVLAVAIGLAASISVMQYQVKAQTEALANTAKKVEVVKDIAHQNDKKIAVLKEFVVEQREANKEQKKLNGSIRNEATQAAYMINGKVDQVNRDIKELIMWVKTNGNGH